MDRYELQGFIGNCERTGLPTVAASLICDGEPAQLVHLVPEELDAHGVVCGPNCTIPPVPHLKDVPGDEPLSNSGDFVVRTVVMDLTECPELRVSYEWSDNVRLVTSLTDAEEPVPTEMLPFVMYGVGLIERGCWLPAKSTTAR